MDILLSLILLAGGVMAAYPMIVQKQPNARDLLDRLMPYQGITGVVLGIVGVILVFKVVGNLGVMLSLGWLLMVASTVCALGLGFLMGYNILIKGTLANNEQAMRKAEALRAKLLGYQIPLGIAAIAIALLSVVLRIL